jgi:2-oxoglutarate ferredoxin oxidoreductase subunit alpha
MADPSRSPASRPSQAPEAAARDSVTLTLAGSGGDGVALLGELLLRMAAQQGLYGMMVQSYGPQIRGGESAVVVRVAREEVQYEGDESDLLLCFRVADLQRFRGGLRLHERSLVVLDAADETPLPAWLGASVREPYRYAFTAAPKDPAAAPDPRNMLALGLLTRALGWAPALAQRALEQRLGHRPERLTRNLEAFDRGYAAADMPPLPRFAGHGAPLVVETGNEAVARGAMDAGLRFFAGYPITPSSEILETLIEELPGRGGRVVQAEDEIASLGMVLGASFGNVPAMTATSGPGLSLMTEMLGLSSMTEIPAVIVDCQRAGPATGMPSRMEQSDLFHSVFGGHGDFPRVVLAALDVVHARETMHRAFHLSETYRLPVLVLSDAYIAQRRQICDPVVETRAAPRRHTWTPQDDPLALGIEDVVPAFHAPGTPDGTVLIAGLEHTEQGWPTADGVVHQAMNERRFLKLPRIAAETADWCRTLGAADAPRGLIAWGSTYGVLREWVREHPDFRVFLPEILHPFPLAALARWRAGLRWCAVLEMSYGGQLHRILSGLTDLKGVHSLARSGGVPITLHEIAERVGAVL